MIEANIDIKKFKNGNISLKLLNAKEVEHNNDIYNADDIWHEDLYFHIDGAGWLHIIDINTSRAYNLDNYGYDWMAEMKTGKTVKIYPMSKEDSSEILKEWLRE